MDLKKYDPENEEILTADQLIAIVLLLDHTLITNVVSRRITIDKLKQISDAGTAARILSSLESIVDLDVVDVVD